MLYIDLWQSRQSKISLTGYSSCGTKWLPENRWCVGSPQEASHVGWQPEECMVVMTLYIHEHPRQNGQSVRHSVTRVPSRECREGRRSSGPQAAPFEYLSSEKQRRKALNMESQRGLRKGRYSRPLPAESSVCLRRPVCLSHTLTPALTLSNYKVRRIFFI